MIDRRIIASLTVGLYFIIVLYHFIISNIIPIVFVSGILTGIPVINKIKGRNALIFVLILILIFWSLLVTRLNNDGSTLSLLLLPAYFIALNIKYNFVWDRLFLVIFYLFFSYTLFQIIQGTELSEILNQSSRNYVGAILLIFLITHYIIDNYNKKKLVIFHAILLLLLSIMLYGRANIIVSVLLLFLVVFYRFPQLSLKIKIFALIIASILAITFVELYQPYSEAIEIVNRFEDRGFESVEREIALFGYFDKINSITLLSGVPSNQYPFTILDGNLHNSFLRAHSIFGILCLTIFYMIFIAIKYLNIYSFLLGLILLRAFTDTIFFVGVFDYLWLLVFLIQSDIKLKYK